MNNEHRELSQELTSANGQLTTCREECANLQAQLTSCREERAKLQTNVDSYEVDYKALQKDYDYVEDLYYCLRRLFKAKIKEVFQATVEIREPKLRPRAPDGCLNCGVKGLSYRSCPEPYAGHVCQICSHPNFSTEDCPWPHYKELPKAPNDDKRCKCCWRSLNLTDTNCYECLRRLIQKNIALRNQLAIELEVKSVVQKTDLLRRNSRETITRSTILGTPTTKIRANWGKHFQPRHIFYTLSLLFRHRKRRPLGKSSASLQASHRKGRHRFRGQPKVVLAYISCGNIKKFSFSTLFFLACHRKEGGEVSWAVDS